MNRYRIEVGSPQAHLFRVELTIPQPAVDGQMLSMAAWIPGSYMIRDFARNIVRLWASSAGRPVSVAKLDKQTWRCEPTVGELSVAYEVYAYDPSVRAAYLDTTRGYFNGTSVFLHAVGHQHLPCTVEIVRPLSPECGDWKVATSMEATAVDDRGFGFYRASDYDELIDHPVELGHFERIRFEVSGVLHDIVLSGRQDADLERLARDLKAVCRQHGALFGELPTEKYLFLVNVVGEGYGGLEHRASTSLICSRDDLPVRGEREIADGYRRFLGLCSHEYFHLWNVKRIRPQVFLDQGLSAEVHTRLLWVFEGITSYYDDLALVRSGVIDVESYLTLVARNISYLMRGSGRLKQSLEESSFDAWTKFYKQDENAPNAIVSYYTKGGLVALLLDLKIRLDSNGRASLDDVMRAFWRRYGKTGRGVGENDVERLVEEVAGLDLSSFFAHALRSTRELEFNDLLAQFGVGMRLRPARDQADEGGLEADPGDFEGEAPPTLGAGFSTRGGAAVLTYVRDGGAAQESGLAAGDEILAVNGIRVQADSLAKRVVRVPRGESVRVHAIRRDELMEFRVTPKPAPADTCVLRLLTSVPPETLKRREDWLQVEA